MTLKKIPARNLYHLLRSHLQKCRLYSRLRIPNLVQSDLCLNPEHRRRELPPQPKLVQK
jgi:hypothetical protein